MFIYNSNNSDKSTFATIIKVLMIALTVWQATVQAYTFLAFTRTKLGSRIRKGFLHTAIDFAEESIDATAERLPAIYKKMDVASNKMKEAMK